MMTNKTWALLAVVSTLILALVISKIEPAPPNHLTIATGDEESELIAFAKEYKDILAQDGVKLEIRPSIGPLENLKLLEDDKASVEAAFVQDGLGSEAKQPDVLSLGSLYYEPIWIFYRAKTIDTHFSELYGKKIAVGKMGHGTQVLAERLLKLTSVDPTDAELINMNSFESARALKEGKIDAAIFMLPPEHHIIRELALDKNIKLMNVAQAEAISRKDSAFHHLVLPRGAIDLEADIPNTDVNLVASTATLLIRDDLHPALAYLLLKAAAEVHSSPGVFEKRNEFPTNKDDAFPLSKDAIQFYKSGGTFWQRYLPYWMAAWFDRFILIVIPLLAFILPLIRLVPRLYHWRLRTKIYQRYGELKFLETQLKTNPSEKEYEDYLHQLFLIEDRVNKMKMPQNYSEYIYSLKGHIQFVRDRIEKTTRQKA